MGSITIHHMHNDQPAELHACLCRRGFGGWCESDRTRRVYLLVAGIIILSVADLVITLAFLRAHLMLEANPIAAYLIRSTQSSWALTAYKMASVGVCVGLLLKLRRHAAGEAAAWFAVGILAVLSVMWHSYSRHIDDQNFMILAHSTAMDDYRLGLPVR
jgi:hypothetical protein